MHALNLRYFMFDLQSSYLAPMMNSPSHTVNTLNSIAPLNWKNAPAYPHTEGTIPTLLQSSLEGP